MRRVSLQGAMRSKREGTEAADGAYLAGGTRDRAEALHRTESGRKLYEKRKQTIERVFADAKEKHAMRYTHYRGLAAVSRWVRLK